MFRNNSIYSRYLVVMGRRPTLTVQSQTCGASTVSWMISHYLAGERKAILSSNQVRTCAYTESVTTFIWSYLPPYPIVNLKAFDSNAKNQQKNLKKVERCFLFCKCWGRWHCHVLSDSLQSVFSIKRMWPKSNQRQYIERRFQALCLSVVV